MATGEVTWAGSFAVERLPPDRPARRTAESPLDELARRIVDAMIVDVMSGHLQPIVVHGDADHDGIPAYLNRRANPADHNRDGLPDYLNRYFLRRRPL